MFAKDIRLAQELRQTAHQKARVINLLKLTPLPQVPQPLESPTCLTVVKAYSVKAYHVTIWLPTVATAALLPWAH